MEMKFGLGAMLISAAITGILLGLAFTLRDVNRTLKTIAVCHVERPVSP